MSKQYMNMHTSQITHGIVKGDDFESADDNVVEVGYSPAMIKIMAVEAADDPQDFFHWYSVEGDYIFRFNATNEGRHDAFVEVTEKGFILDGAALIAASGGTPVGFMFETYGCKYEDSRGLNPDNPNPEPVSADDAMDPIPQWYPEQYSPDDTEYSETESL